MQSYKFSLDNRLGIYLPVLQLEWDEYPEEERAAILDCWEQVRGRIPQRIMELEGIINDKQSQLNNEDNFKTACQLNSDIAETASCINDLHLYFRINQDIAANVIHR